MPAEDLLNKITRSPDVFSGDIRHLEAVEELLATFCALKLPLELYMDQYVYPFHSTFTASQEDREGRYLLISLLSPEFSNKFIEKTQSLILIATHNQVQYLFLSHFKRFVEAPSALIRVDFPYVLQYHRIREHFRTEIPKSQTIWVTIPVDQTSEYGIVSAPLVDISFGGFSFISSVKDSDLRVGQEIDQVKFNLPVEGQIITKIAIRNMTQLEGPLPEDKMKFGVEFIDLSKDQLDKIRSYSLFIMREQLRQTIEPD